MISDLKKFLCKILVIFVILCTSTACVLFEDKHNSSIEFTISNSIVKPNGHIIVKLTQIPDKADASKTVWSVNDVVQNVSNNTLDFTTGSIEKRYEIAISTYTSKGGHIETVVIPCYATNNEKLIKAVYEYIDKYDYKPAISVSVLGKDLSFNFADGYASMSSKNANIVETQHILYSITKSFTAASILKLRDEGMLSLSDRLDRYVTGLSPVYINNDATIEELLTHRSGISDYTSNPQLIINNPFQSGAEWKPEKILNYIEYPADDRGKFIYSSANYVILGMIVEQISGVKLNQYISDNFLIPLNLTDLKLAPEDTVSYTDIAHPHAYPGTFMGLVGDGVTPVDIADVIANVSELQAKCGWSAGGMIGTADLAAKWGYNLLSANGEVDTTIKEAITGSLLSFTESDSPDIAYGIATRKLYHNGKAFIGSYGRSIGDENLMFYNADKDVCIVILTSSNMRKDNTPNIDELMYSIYDVL